MPTTQLGMMDLDIGMEQAQVVKILGEPHSVVGAKRFEDGTLEVWLYRRYYNKYGPEHLETPLEQYHLYFYNDKLEQWGRPGDWETEADRIYELRVR